MDKDTYDRGLVMRRRVLGDAYVDRSLANVDDFNRDFQRIVTQYGWGETWVTHAHAARALDPQPRHDRGARKDAGVRDPFPRGDPHGLTPDELRAVLTQIAAYCGLPVGVDCFRTGQKVLNEGK